MTPIRVAVILDARHAPGPGERRLLCMLRDDPRFELAGVAAAEGPEGGVPGPVALAMRIEARGFPAPDLAPRPEVAPGGLAVIAASGARVAVDFSCAAEILDSAPPEGVWRLTSFAPGAGTGAARDGAAVTQVALLRHRAGAAPEVLATAAYERKFLASRNAAFIREKSVQMVEQALARLALGRPFEPAPPPVPERAMSTGDLPGYALRTGAELIRRSGAELGKRLGHRANRFVLRVGHGGPDAFDPSTSAVILPPKGQFWADPFLFEEAGTTWLFYEGFDDAEGRGHLAVGRLEADSLVPVGRVMDAAHHLSFPFVFRWGDEILMIPETHQSRRVEVWRATAFPLGWERVATGLEGLAAVDTVVFERNGQWWLLTNICRDSFGDFCAELHAYMIDSPMLDGLRPHPLNPVVIDTRTARGAGRVLEVGGRLIRASQNNSHGVYGYGLNLMEIEALGPTEYRERVLRQITPETLPGIAGCHHIDFGGGRFVIDVREG